MTTTAGQVNISLYHRGGHSCEARIISARPETARVLLGKTPEQVLTAVPLLFSVCGNAQAYTALQACRSALGIAAEPKLDAARRMLVQVETLREHVWRILLGWPCFVGLEADKKPLAALLKFDARFKRFLFRDGQGFSLASVLDVDTRQLTALIAELESLIDAAIFKGGLSDFQTIRGEADLLEWLQGNRSLPAYLLNDLFRRNWAAAGRNDIGCLADMNSRILNRHMQQQDLRAFSRMPHWQGRCLESTVLSRQLWQPLIAELQNRYQNGLMARILARLLEVSGIPSRLRHLLICINDGSMLAADGEIEEGVGLGQVQAARGLLIHRLTLRQGRVKDYCIVAPTEWNFHPEGVAAQGLKALQASDPAELRLQAELLIDSIDPCVQYDLKLFDSDKVAEIHA